MELFKGGFDRNDSTGMKMLAQGRGRGDGRAVPMSKRGGRDSTGELHKRLLAEKEQATANQVLFEQWKAGLLAEQEAEELVHVYQPGGEFLVMTQAEYEEYERERLAEDERREWERREQIRQEADRKETARREALAAKAEEILATITPEAVAAAVAALQAEAVSLIDQMENPLPEPEPEVPSWRKAADTHKANAAARREAKAAGGKA